MRRILVVTEGTRTEPQYVEGLNHYLRDGGATAVVKSVAVGKDPLKVVQKCMEKRDSEEGRGKDFDDCVCLVDVDQHEMLPAAGGPRISRQRGKGCPRQRHSGAGALVAIRPG